MKRIRITDPGHSLFARAWKLYEKSFPLHEQRLPEDQEAVLAEPGYHFEVLEQAGRFVGLVLYWENARFIYIEHLAIDPSMRGAGMGTKIMDLLMQSGKQIILEIDPVEDQLSANRLNFYKRMGFKENAFLHIHPPYRAQFEGHKLHLLSWPARLENDAYNAFTFYLTNKVMAYAEQA
ncbi:MAG: GNAT family N-acetyltransferase [Clostridia bacterium]|nr:GNAT family N-acetyltransferase [Clostridia bacterium]